LIINRGGDAYESFLKEGRAFAPRFSLAGKPEELIEGVNKLKGGG